MELYARCSVASKSVPLPRFPGLRRIGLELQQARVWKQVRHPLQYQLGSIVAQDIRGVRLDRLQPALSVPYDVSFAPLRFCCRFRTFRDLTFGGFQDWILIDAGSGTARPSDSLGPAACLSGVPRRRFGVTNGSINSKTWTRQADYEQTAQCTLFVHCEQNSCSRLPARGHCVGRGF